MVGFSRWVFCACTSIALATSTPADAFGLKTHIWIGQQLLAEILSSCRVNVERAPIPIDSEVCASLRSNPGAFMAGVLGPDAFPDLITGQVTTHPGIEGDWQTSDWLVHLYAKAVSGPELAFAAGYLVHAASDSFAHSYVNAYAGDIFVLSDERRVELRHFLLEKYIDSRLPGYAYDTSGLQPPAEWLRDKLIHNADASRLAAKSGLAAHVASMHNIHREVGHLADELDRIEKDAAELIVGVPLQIQEASLKLATGETALDAASVTLRAEEQRLKIQQDLLDAENRLLQDAIRLLQENTDKINSIAQQARLAREAAELAQRVGNEAVDEAARLHSRLLDLERQIQSVPQYLLREVCRDEVVGSACGIFCPVCGNVCKDIVNSVCRTVQDINQAWMNLQNEILNVRGRIADAQARAAKAAIDVTTQFQIEQAKLQELASERLLTAGLQAAKDAAQFKYELQMGALSEQIKLTQATRETVDKLKEETAKLRQRLVDLGTVEEVLKDLIARSDLLSGLVKNWRSGMDTAGREFINAGNTVAKGLLDGNGQFVSTYLEWWKCSGNAYVGIPIQFGQSVCGFENMIERVEDEMNKFVERTLPPPFNRVYADVLNLKTHVKVEIKNAINDGALNLAKLVAPDEATRQLIDVLARPQNASQSMMNDAFATAADSDKPLLVFDRISDLVDSDLGSTGGPLDPERFAAVRNAVTLSKLALMDVSGVRKLAWVLGADDNKITAPQSPGRTSPLFDMLRSIDGNHQWQPYGLPYASSDGKHRPEEPLHRRYGYGPGQERPGFQLFVDQDLRRSMFLRLFDGPLNPSLQARLPAYPFIECERHPFAVTFLPNGDGAKEDVACAGSPEAPPGTTRWEWLRRFLNLLRLNPAN